MITLTIVEQVKKNKLVSYKRSIKIFHSTDKAKKFIIPVVKEMKIAKANGTVPSVRIDGASYDSKSEKALLLELDAITSIENEHDDNY